MRGVRRKQPPLRALNGRAGEGGLEFPPQSGDGGTDGAGEATGDGWGLVRKGEGDEGAVGAVFHRGAMGTVGVSGCPASAVGAVGLFPDVRGVDRAGYTASGGKQRSGQGRGSRYAAPAAVHVRHALPAGGGRPGDTAGCALPYDVLGSKITPDSRAVCGCGRGGATCAALWPQSDGCAPG